MTLPLDQTLCILFWMSILFAVVGWLKKIDGYVFWIICAVAIRGYY